MGVSGTRQPVDKAWDKIKLQVSMKTEAQMQGKKGKTLFLLHQSIYTEALKPSPTNSWILLSLDLPKWYVDELGQNITPKKKKKRGKRSSDKLNHLAYQNCVFLIHCKFDEAQKLPPSCGNWLLILIQVVKTTVTKDTQREWIWNSKAPEQFYYKNYSPLAQ